MTTKTAATNTESERNLGWLGMSTERYMLTLVNCGKRVKRKPTLEELDGEYQERTSKEDTQ